MATTKSMGPLELRFFINLLLDEEAKGTTSLRKEHFDAIAVHINTQFGTNFDGKWLREKRGRELQNWRIYRDLREHQTGVGVDVQTGAIVASEEQWTNWIKNNADCKKFRRKGLANYEELTELFGSSTATGDFGVAPFNVPSNSDEERIIERRFRSPSGRKEGVTEESAQHFEDGSHSRKTGKKRGIDTPPSSGKKSRSDNWDEALDDWANHRLATAASKDIPVGMGECMDILIKMELEDDSLFAKAMKYFEDPNRRFLWSKCPAERRMGLLKSL